MRFQGIMPAIATPFNKDETVNVKVLKQLISYFLEKDADGFYVGGATGEGIAIKTEERMILAEEAVNEINGRKPCIIQIASQNFEDAVTLAKHAEKVGASAISATPPMFFNYDEDDVFNYYKKLAESVNIPMMIYYNLSTGFNMDAKFAARCFEVDNITAIKWSSYNYYEMMRLKDLTNGEMNILNGPDETLLLGLTAGADGGIGLTYNFIYDIIRDVYKHFKNNDMESAKKAQYDACRVISVLRKYKSIPIAKILLTEMGFDMGSAAFPSKQYSDKEKIDIINDFKQTGLVL